MTHPQCVKLAIAAATQVSRYTGFTADAEGERLLTALREALDELALTDEIHPEDEEDVPAELPTEPEESDYVTTDHRKFYQFGVLAVEVGEDEDYWAALRAHMNKEQYWPDAWLQDDHGGWTLLHEDTPEKLKPKPKAVEPKEEGDTCPNCGGHSFRLKATFDGEVCITFDIYDDSFIVDRSETYDSEWDGPATCRSCHWEGALGDLLPTPDENRVRINGEVYQREETDEG